MNSEPDKLRVRLMAEADVDRVLKIAGRLPGAPQWPRDAYVAALASGAAPRRIALVAEVQPGGEVVGFAVASLLPPEAELETIAVMAGSQRRGIARELFRALATELRSGAVDVILLEVRASNERAQAFYRSLGFTGAGRRPGYYDDPVEDALLMRLELQP